MSSLENLIASTTPGSNYLLDDTTNALTGLLGAGVRCLAYNQQITFTRYKQYILPIDGYLFWIEEPETTFNVSGSIHITTEQRQDVDSTNEVNTVVFTALEPVLCLQEVDPVTLWVGEWQGTRFSFNRRSMYFKQAGLHHYVGTAILPTMSTQFLPSTYNVPQSQILSNSLPFWISLTGPSQTYPGQQENRVFVYPEYLVSENKVPPYISVEIVSTDPLQPNPQWLPISFQQGGEQIVGFTIYQLMMEKVKLHCWGFNNQDIWTYIDYLNTWFLTNGLVGLLDGPVVKDVPVRQSEYNIRGQKKTIEYTISYNQGAALSYAANLISKAGCSIQVTNKVFTANVPATLVPPAPKA